MVPGELSAMADLERFVPPGGDEFVPPGGDCIDWDEEEEGPVPILIPPRSDCYYLGKWIGRETCGCRRKHYRLCEHPELFPITTVSSCQTCDKWEEV